jgi:sigma-B regulation protein RsbU (phosphoserine phosphatase)
MGGTSEETAELRKLSKPGTIIGAFPDMAFHSEAMDLPKFSRLYVFSDGIYEVARPDGTMLKYSDFENILTSSKPGAGSVIEQTFGQIRAVRGEDQFEDDVSIVEVKF